MKKTVSVFLIALMLLMSLCTLGCSDNEDVKEIFERYYNEKLLAYEEENRLYEKGQVDVVFLGDSLTDGYDLKKFYPDYLTLNRGISGDTTVGLEKRLDVSAYDVQPKVVVMLIGANNMDQMLDNYESILKGFEQKLPSSKIILLSLTSMGGEWGRKNQLAAYNNVQIKMLAQKYGYYYVDLYSALLNLETGEIYDEYTTDGGHLTENGYTVLTGCIEPVLKEALGK